MSQGHHDQLRLGFLTAVEDAERGFVGGLLVTNRFGRPLEFQCTAPVKPNRTQQILYGPTLKSYVLAELIGRTLLDKVGVKPHFVLVETPELLDLRNAEAVPVASLVSDKSNRNGEQTSPNRFKLGNETVECGLTHDDDRQQIEKFAKLIPVNGNLREPFERIREALVETIRISVARPA